MIYQTKLHEANYIPIATQLQMPNHVKQKHHIQLFILIRICAQSTKHSFGYFSCPLVSALNLTSCIHVLGRGRNTVPTLNVFGGRQPNVSENAILASTIVFGTGVFRIAPWPSQEEEDT